MSVILKRNMKLFFRDKIAFLMSLLAVTIIIVLYVLFLGDVWGPGAMRALPGADILLYQWLMAGILAVTTITTPFGALIVIVNDRVKKLSKGLYVSPLKRSHIASGYILGAFVASVISAIIMAIIMTIFIAIRGGSLLTPIVYLQIFGVVLLSSLSGTAMMCFIVSFVKSHAVFTTISMLLATLVGFLTGVYFLNNGVSEFTQRIIQFFPPTHAAALLRQVIMDAQMQVTFSGLPNEAVDAFKALTWTVLYVGETEITPFMSVIVLLATSITFYGLSLLSMRINK